MIEITPLLFIDENEIQLEFIRSSGPGGQNVNKVATGVQLRFDLSANASLPEPVKARLANLAGGKMTGEGVLVIEAKRYRTQEQNREDALARLVALIEQAAQPPKPRRKTRPSASSKAERLSEKKRRGAIKRMRGDIGGEY